MDMPISKFFESLGAPLNNIRWSWGAEHPTTGVIYFRVWTDEIKTINGLMYARLTNHAAYAAKQTDLGYLERARHIEKVRQGTQAFCVLCHAEVSAVEAQPRRLVSYCTTPVRAVEVWKHAGDEWICLTA